MRYGVFSDVHANLEAFKAVLNFYDKAGVEELICCGDLVGYGPQPQECVELAISRKNLSSVLGNHDAAVTGRMEKCWFQLNALEAIEFTGRALTPSALAYLSCLPEMLSRPDFIAVHGSPSRPLTEYMLERKQFEETLDLWDGDLCFVGHTHVPVCFRQEPSGFTETFLFDAGRNRVEVAGGRLVINPGSVGQPRDGDCRASCGIYESEGGVFELFRIPYDVAKTRKLMGKAGIPRHLSDRLAFGV